MRSGDRFDGPDAATGSGDGFRIYKRHLAAAETVDRRFTKGDAGAVVRMAVAASAATVIPRESWIPVVDAIPHRRKRSARRWIEAGLAAYFGPRADQEFFSQTSGKYRQASARSLMLYAVEATGRWRPSISVQGRERLEAALAGGRGALLWCDAFVFQSLVGKRGLFQNGFHGHQLSLSNHGYSQTRFGRSRLNPFQQRQELKYAHRLPFEHDVPHTAVRLIFDRLRQGNLVLITNALGAARQAAEMRFGDSAPLRLATGPLLIAQTLGVPLLPFAMFEIEPFRRYEGLVGTNIAPLDPSDGESAEPSIAAAMIKYRSWIEPHIQRFPEQWMRWPGLAIRDPAEPQAEQDT